MLLYPPTQIALAALSYGLQKLGKMFVGLFLCSCFLMFLSWAHPFQERWRTFSVTTLWGYVKLRAGIRVLKKRWWSISFCFALNRFASSSTPNFSQSPKRTRLNYRQVNLLMTFFSRAHLFRRNRADSKLCTTNLRRVIGRQFKLIRTTSSTGYDIFICCIAWKIKG